MCGVVIVVSMVISGVEIDDVNVGVVCVVGINGEFFFESLLIIRVMDLALNRLSFSGFLVVCKFLFVFVFVVVCVRVGGVVVNVVVTEWSS